MYTVKYFWRSNEGGYKMVYHKVEQSEMAERFIRDISRAALKRDYVELYKDDEIIRVVNF